MEAQREEREFSREVNPKCLDNGLVSRGLSQCHLKVRGPFILMGHSERICRCWAADGDDFPVPTTLGLIVTAFPNYMKVPSTEGFSSGVGTSF